jgi:hypothetical protein
VDGARTTAPPSEWRGRITFKCTYTSTGTKGWQVNAKILGEEYRKTAIAKGPNTVPACYTHFIPQPRER